MDGLIILLVLYALAAPAIAVAVALAIRARARGLENRLRRLEHRVERLRAPQPGMETEAGTEPPGIEQTAPETEWQPRREPEWEPVRTTEPAPAPEPIVPIVTRAPRAGRASLEQALGKRATTIVGAVALALGIVFLVRHSIVQGWWPDWLRVSSGAAASVFAIAAATRLHARFPLVADGLAAAGVAGIYACLFVAHAVHGWIPAAPAFVTLGAHTLLAVLLSLRHGPIVALLGLAGGFAMPGFIATDQPAPYILVAYLLALQGGLQSVVRRAGWWLLGAATFAASLLWLFLLAQQPPELFPRPLLGLLLLGSLAIEKLGLRPGAPAVAVHVSAAGTAAGLAAAIALLVQAEFQLAMLPFASASIAGTLVLARMDPRMPAFAWLGLAASAGLVATAAFQPAVGNSLLLAVSGGHLLLLLAFAALALVRGGAPQPAAEYAVLAVLGVAAILWFDRGDRFAPGEFGLLLVPWSALLALATAATRRRLPAPAGVLALGTALLSLFAAATELPVSSLGALLAAAGAICLWIARRLPARYGLVLGLGLVAASLSLQLADPFLDRAQLAPHWLGNRLVAEHALAVLAFAAAARVARGWIDGLATALRNTTLAALLWLLLLLVRLWFHPAQPQSLEMGLAETAALGAVLWIFPLLLSARPPAPRAWWFALPALAHGCLLACYVRNPLLVELPAGGSPVLNLLLPLWVLPAAAAAWIARAAARGNARNLALLFGGAALLLGWLWLTGTIRQCFVGPVIRLGEVGIAESFTWSIGWLIAAILLLLAGIRWRIDALRRVALLLLAVTTCKVFLADTSHLEGLWRVLSFFGLGIGLLGIGALYQRLEAQR